MWLSWSHTLRASRLCGGLTAHSIHSGRRARVSCRSSYSRSARGEKILTYHLRAAITACRCAALDYDSAKRRRIFAFCDLRFGLQPLLMIALNRAGAVAKVHGAQAGIDALAQIRGQSNVQSYHLFHAIPGEFERQLRRGAFQAGAHVDLRGGAKLSSQDMECEPENVMNETTGQELVAR